MTPSSPVSVPRAVRLLAWLNLVGNIAIIGTGGAVRLTASGLGCPTWPTCTDASWVPTSDLSGHSLIEFANRMMSPLLAVLALALVIVVWRLAHPIIGARALSGIILGGIVAQAVLGGVTVLTGLNAIIVGAHFIASAVLVGIAAALVATVERTRRPYPNSSTLPRWVPAISHTMSGALAVTLVLGVFTTGSGPHSGDDTVIRDSHLWQVFVEIHAIAAYLLVGTVAVLVFAAWRWRVAGPFRAAATALLGGIAVEIALGISQARLGIPGSLVAAHMILAGILITLAVWTMLACRPAAHPSSGTGM